MKNKIKLIISIFLVLFITNLAYGQKKYDCTEFDINDTLYVVLNSDSLNVTKKISVKNDNEYLFSYKLHLLEKIYNSQGYRFSHSKRDESKDEKLRDTLLQIVSDTSQDWRTIREPLKILKQIYSRDEIIYRDADFLDKINYLDMEKLQFMKDEHPECFDNLQVVKKIYLIDLKEKEQDVLTLREVILYINYGA